MIPAGSQYRIMRVPTVDIVLETAHNREDLDGPLRDFYNALMDGQDVPPVLVNEPTQYGKYVLRDGKKRWLAHVLAARPTTLAVVVLAPRRLTPVATPVGSRA